MKFQKPGNTSSQEEKGMKPKVTVVYDTTDDSQLRTAFRLLAELFKERQDRTPKEAGSERR